MDRTSPPRCPQCGKPMGLTFVIPCVEGGDALQYYRCVKCSLDTVRTGDRDE
jgi:hypothetical protein